MTSLMRLRSVSPRSQPASPNNPHVGEKVLAHWNNFAQMEQPLAMGLIRNAHISMEDDERDLGLDPEKLEEEEEEDEVETGEEDEKY